MDHKIYSIVKNKDDIIFLSDTRLNSINQISGLNDLEKKLAFFGYTLYHNSRKSSRGVGILISRKIKHTVIRRVIDEDDNILLLDIDFTGISFTLGTIYGPNEDDMSFFDTLKKGIKDLKNANIIIGGDWNSTWDNAEVNVNIDVINMANIPSRRRSDKLREICTELNLTDPYRTFYPTRREYTYIPSALGLTNRSRLDFFIISESVLNKTVNCSVPHSLTSTVFDHKPVFLTTKRKKIIHKQSINDIILDDPDLNFHVTITVYETYIHHTLLNEKLNEDRKNEILHAIGQILALLQRIRSYVARTIDNNLNNLGVMETEGLRAEVRELIDNLPGLPFFENLDLTCNKATFFEVLSSSVKNITLGHQAWIFKIRNKLKTTLTRHIKNLKQDFNNNTVEILALERRLSSIIEAELRTELLKIKNFERLNNEKITPVFLKIAKSSQSDDSLDSLLNEQSQPFNSKDDQNEHITGYYETIYKKPVNEQNVTQNDINDFLGDSVNHPTVNNSKLTEAEKLTLESQITINELEKSMSESNLASAPGTDGISNKFIRHFWSFFCTPLRNYANHCFTTGQLTDSFRGAKIRLIPKKGDTSKIKNWRPISLLNCFYKILSRVLTNRLRLYIDKLTPVCQKGYSQTRQCQEVLISVSDCVSKCNRRNIQGALLSLDISKAFDTLSHRFLDSALVFFNFGENYRRWIRLLATNRTACIILSESKLSRSFNLERGNAQGDTISPFLFIICYQILLFKLEYDLQILGLIEEDRIPDTLPGVPAQVPIQTCRVFAYADDGNILVRMDVGSLRRIKEILNEFGIISGLVCNVEKTCLMQIGSNLPISQEITDLGFNIVNEMTILGMKVGGDPERNFLDILQKVHNQKLFWVRFNLSLPGRINIAKSMMYSQINYLGCILPLDITQLQRLSTIIEDFVKGNLNISRKRLTTSCAEGGLGLFNLSDFLDAQRCAWIKRAQKLDDHWKRRLYAHSYGSILNIRAEHYDNYETPILHCIAKSYERFFSHHTMWNENFRTALIYDNPALNTNLRTQDTADAHFFGELFATHTLDIYKLKMTNVYNRGYVSLDTFIQETGIPISERKLIGLRGVYDVAAIRYSKENGNLLDNTEIATFVNRFKKGSRSFRRVFRGKRNLTIPNNIARFAGNTETIIGLDLSEILNTSWNISYLENSLRTFIFKLHNNILTYNHVLAHFAENIEPYCTFCLITRNNDPERDTVLHVFYSCPITEQFNERFFSWIFGVNRIVGRSEVFGIFKEENVDNNKILFIITKISQKYIWDCKLRKTLPALDDLKNIVKSEVQILRKISITFNDCLQSCSLLTLK